MKNSMKLAALVLGFTLMAAMPRPAGYVNDFAGIVKSDHANLIAGLAGSLESKSGAQFALVTVKSLDGMSIDDYAWRLFEKWGIGQKGEDNGVLLLVAPNQRKLRIEVGYGFEGAIPDGKAGQIIREDILPYFRKNMYSEGIVRGAAVLMQIMAAEKGVELEIPQGAVPEHKRKDETSPLMIILQILFIILIFGGRWFFFPMIFGGFGYHSGGGGGFGGFGGFGGGLSGGGGASGSW